MTFIYVNNKQLICSYFDLPLSFTKASQLSNKNVSFNHWHIGRNLYFVILTVVEKYFKLICDLPSKPRERKWVRKHGESRCIIEIKRDIWLGKQSTYMNLVSVSKRVYMITDTFWQERPFLVSLLLFLTWNKVVRLLLIE